MIVGNLKMKELFGQMFVHVVEGGGGGVFDVGLTGSRATVIVMNTQDTVFALLVSYCTSRREVPTALRRVS